MVREMVGVTREEELWSIQRVVLSGDTPASLSLLRDLLEISRVDPVPLTWAFSDLARRLHGVVRGVKQGENMGAVLRQYKLWPPMSDMVLAAARKLTPEAAAGLLQASIEADQKQKTSAGDAVHILEALVLRFTSTLSSAVR